MTRLRYYLLCGWQSDFPGMQKALLGLLLLLTTSGSLHAQQQEMTMLSYNVLHGFNNDSLLEKRYVEWVSALKPDIIAYQELNGFTQDSLEALAKKYGHPYAILNTGVTHPIGLTSKYPIVWVQQVTTNMWHSYLYANVNGVHVLVTHLSPFDVESRRQDIDRVMAHARLLPAAEPVLLAGDLNSLAAADSSEYGEKLAKQMQESEGRLEPKSGLPIVKGKTIYRHNLNNGWIDYTVTNKLIDAGWQDAFYLTNRRFQASVPTSAYAKKSTVFRRIDYIWVNRTLAEHVKEARIIQDDITRELSDHYPMFVRFTH